MLNGAVYSSTRLLLSSETHKFPLESKIAYRGPFRPVALVAAVLAVKLDWPITRLAAWPLENEEASAAGANQIV